MNNLLSEAELIKLSFQGMYLEKARQGLERTGLHASALLVSENEWCTRRHVLLDVFPEESQQPPLHNWDWKREKIFDTGWKLHESWQSLFHQFGNVVLSDDNRLPELDL